MTDSHVPYMKNNERNAYEQTREAQGARIAAVAEGSPAAECGLEPGDTLVSLNGVAPRDILDWYWASDENSVDLVVWDAQGQMHEAVIERELGQEWGIEFETLVFDGVQRCANNCAFCFMNQLPQGMRPSLYLKDDDYRLSFLQGNFVTLTNLNEDDLERIKQMRISPLNVSFHAADDAVRTRLIGRNAPKGKENFVRLAEAGIHFNVQIVLVPDVNDREVLDDTLTWLAQYKDVVQTIGIVPVAYTRQTKEIAGNPPKSFTDQLDAARVIQQVQSYQFKERAENKRTWIHLADEFYINAQAPFPQEEWYDGFGQYENGIGIVWEFVNDIKEHFEELSNAVAAIPEGSDAVTLVIGELAKDSFIGALTALNAGGRVRLMPVRNKFFGGNVTVTALLTGQDISEAINYDAARCDKPSIYLVPDSIFNADGLTLDNWSSADIIEKTTAEVAIHKTTIAGLIECLHELEGKM